MVRRLPILITLFLLCASCFTFRNDLEIRSDADNADPDMDVADAANDANNRNNVADGDMDRVRDMDRSDDMADTADFADLPGDPDLGMVDQLIVTSETCTTPQPHQSLFDQQRELSGSFGQEISLANFAGSLAWLSWTQNNSARFVNLTITDSTVTRDEPLQLVPDAMDGNVLTTTVGTGDDLDPGSGISSASATRCTNATIWWGLVGDGLVNSISYNDPTDCPMPSPQLFPMEVGGGWNPFLQATSGVTRRFVYLSDEGIIGGLAGAFDMSDATSSPVELGANPFLLTTKGRLAFYPNAIGRLMAWDTNQVPNSEADPIETPLTGVRRLGIDIEALDSLDRYVVARVVGSDRIALELWEYTLANEFEIVGEWLELDGLTDPTGVEVATFEGGFVVWYQTEDGAEQRWWVHPFTVNGDALVQHTCAYSHQYSNVTYVDNDLIAYRDELGLQVRAAVLFEFSDAPGMQHINVEGPFFTDLFE